MTGARLEMKTNTYTAGAEARTPLILLSSPAANKNDKGGYLKKKMTEKNPRHRTHSVFILFIATAVVAVAYVLCLLLRCSGGGEKFPLAPRNRTNSSNVRSSTNLTGLRGGVGSFSENNTKKRYKHDDNYMDCGTAPLCGVLALETGAGKGPYHGKL